MPCLVRCEGEQIGQKFKTLPLNCCLVAKEIKGVKNTKRIYGENKIYFSLIFSIHVWLESLRGGKNTNQIPF